MLYIYNRLTVQFKVLKLLVRVSPTLWISSCVVVYLRVFDIIGLYGCCRCWCSVRDSLLVHGWFGCSLLFVLAARWMYSSGIGTGTSGLIVTATGCSGTLALGRDSSPDFLMWKRSLLYSLPLASTMYDLSFSFLTTVPWVQIRDELGLILFLMCLQLPVGATTLTSGRSTSCSGSS